MSVYREGNVAIVNAPGTGIADDKATYTYVPDMIKYYLNEEPILKRILKRTNLGTGMNWILSLKILKIWY